MRDKFVEELRLLELKYGLIMTKITILNMSIAIQEQLEEMNNIFITARSSEEIKQAKKRWKNELHRTEREMDNMINIIKEEQKRK